MDSISLLLDRFKKIIRNDKESKKFIILAIEKITQIKVREQDVTISNNTIFINCSPGEKNQLLIFKKAILKKMAATMKGAPSEIR